MSCGVGGSDPALLWLWRRPVATAPNGPLAWEPPHASSSALKRQKDKRTKGQTNKQTNKKTKNKQKKKTTQTEQLALTATFQKMAT